MRLAPTWFVLVLLVFTYGCGRKQAPPPAPVIDTPEQSQPMTEMEAQAGEPAVAARPEPPPPAPTPALIARAENVVRQNVVGDVDAFLTGELRNFIQQKKRMPASFAEFAGLRLDTIPRPPAGKKWVIDTESLEVKSVPAQQ